MHHGRRERILVDVGGTLWPDIWPARDEDVQQRAVPPARVADAAVSEEVVTTLVARLRSSPAVSRNGDRQDTDGWVCSVVETSACAGCSLMPRWSVRRCACLRRGAFSCYLEPASFWRRPPEWGSRSCWSATPCGGTGEAYLRDFADLGLDRWWDRRSGVVG